MSNANVCVVFGYITRRCMNLRSNFEHHTWLPGCVCVHARVRVCVCGLQSFVKHLFAPLTMMYMFDVSTDAVIYTSLLRPLPDMIVIIILKLLLNSPLII